MQLSSVLQPSQPHERPVDQSVVSMFWAGKDPSDKERQQVKINLERNPYARIVTDRAGAFEGCGNVCDLDKELEHLFKPEFKVDPRLKPEVLESGIRQSLSGGKNIVPRAADLYKLCKIYRDGGAVSDIDTSLPAGTHAGHGLLVATRENDTYSGNHCMSSSKPGDPVIAEILVRAQNRIDGTRTIADVAYDPAVDALPHDVGMPYKEMRGYLDLAKAHGLDISDAKACREFELASWPEHREKPWGKAVIQSVLDAQEKHINAEGNPDLPDWKNVNQEFKTSNQDADLNDAPPPAIQKEGLLGDEPWEVTQPHKNRLDIEIAQLQDILENHESKLSKPQRMAVEQLKDAKVEFKVSNVNMWLWSLLNGPRFSSTLTFAGPNAISRALYEACLRHGKTGLTAKIVPDQGEFFIVPPEHHIDRNMSPVLHPVGTANW